MVTLMVQLTLSMAGREPDRQLDRQTAPRPNGRDAAPKRAQTQTKSRLRLEMKMKSMEFQSHPYRDTGIQ